jgi:hypothetical protein
MAKIHRSTRQKGTGQRRRSQRRTSQRGTSQNGTSTKGTSTRRTSQRRASQRGTSQRETSEKGASQKGDEPEEDWAVLCCALLYDTKLARQLRFRFGCRSRLSLERPRDPSFLRSSTYFAGVILFGFCVFCLACASPVWFVSVQ